MERSLSVSTKELNRQPGDILDYLAGFFDVSGSITIERNPVYRNRGLVYNYTLRAELERVDSSAIQVFDETIPGYHTNRPLDSGKIRRRWYVKARRAGLLLTTLGPHFRLKAGHLEVIQRFTDTVGQRTADESELLKTEMANLNKNPRVSFDHSITEPYLAGVFDGHGSIGVARRSGRMLLSARVTVNCREFMTGVGSYLGTTVFPDVSQNGEILTYVVALYGERAAHFLHKIQPYSVRYRQLVPLALEFQDLWGHSKGKKRSREELDVLIRARELLIRTRGITLR